MEHKIKALFDLHKFSPQPKLSALIEETETRCFELSDLDLENISAAGELFHILIPENKDHDAP